MLRSFTKKILLPIVILMAAVGFSFALFTPNTRADRDKANAYFRKGIELYNDYKYQASINFFLESLSYYPRHHEARKILGQAHYFSGDVHDAIQEWTTIFKYGGKYPSLRLHIQNLTSLDKELQQGHSFNYFSKIHSRIGFRYAFPTFITILPNHNLLVLAQDHSGNGNFLEISPNKKFIGNIKRISAKLELPISAALNEKELWVSDYGSDIIHRMKWSKRGKQYPLLFSKDELGTSGSKPMEFRGPAGICYHRGFFFIADNGNHRIQKITEDGEFNLVFNETKEDNYLNEPFGIACHESGKIYVSEVNEGRIAVFDEYGNFEEYIGEDFLTKPRHLHLNNEQTHLVIADEQAGVLLLDLERDEIQKIKEYSKGEQEIESLVRPYSAVLDQNQNLFIADYSSHSVLHFLPEEYLHKNIELWIEKVDSRRFPMVGLWVSVQDHTAKYLTTLKDSNFTIMENGAQISSLRSDYLEQFEDQMSAVVLLSRDKKMKEYSDSALWTLNFIMNDLRKEDKLKVVSYDAQYRDETPWTNSRLRLKQGVRQAGKIKEDSLTNETSAPAAGRALYYSASELLPKKGKKALIWLHEGEISDQAFESIGLQKISNYLKAHHIRLYVVSFENPEILNPHAKKQNLARFAEKTGGRYYRAFSSELQRINQTIRRQENRNFVISYQSGGNEEWKDQYMDLKVIVNFQGRVGTETAGYFIP